PAIKFDGEHCGTNPNVGPVVDARPVVVEMIATVDTDATMIPLRTGTGFPSEGVTVQFGGGGVSATARVGGNDFVQALIEEGVPHHYAYRCPAAGDANWYSDGDDSAVHNIGTTPGSATGNSGVTVGAQKLSGSVDLGFVGSLADVAIYDTDIGEARIKAHAAAFLAPWDGDTTGERIDRLLDVAGWPSALRDLAKGYSVLGPATLGADALTLLKRAERVEQGRLFVSRDGKVTL